MTLRPSSDSLDDLLREAAAEIHAADALLITSGAGMGVDSGLPDFRSERGFWRAYPRLAELGRSFKEMANPGWFERDPHLAWAFYGHRLNLYRQTVPHEGFHRLLEIAASKPAGYFVFTSNVDGQFQKAGFAPDRIVECHGSIHHFQCTVPCCTAIWSATGETVVVDEGAFRAQDPLPICKRCGGLARPNILMFNDWNWLSQRTDAQEGQFDSWLERLARSSARLVVIELGAGTAIPTVRVTSEQVARRFAARLIRINPREAEVPGGHIGLPMGAAEAVRRILTRNSVLEITPPAGNQGCAQPKRRTNGVRPITHG